MKNVIKTTQEVEKVIGLTCDMCHKKYTDIMEMQEFLEIYRIGGYNSIFGDEVCLKADICQYCLKIILKDVEIKLENLHVMVQEESHKEIPVGTVLCRHCFGLGKKEGKDCVECSGTGRLETHEQIK